MNSFQYKVARYSKLPWTLKWRLRTLTLSYEQGDSNMLNWLRRPPEDDRVVLANCGKKTVGWAHLNPKPRREDIPEPVFQVFVDPDIRGRGVGTRLAARCRRTWGPRPGVVWTAESACFYSGLLRRNIIGHVYDIRGDCAKRVERAHELRT
jgi:GNAT superfamily N-acetyltransferase